jgi:HSP20 family protein
MFGSLQPRRVEHLTTASAKYRGYRGEGMDWSGLLQNLADFSSALESATEKARYDYEREAGSSAGGFARAAEGFAKAQAADAVKAAESTEEMASQWASTVGVIVPVDVEEREDSYYLAMDVPGLQKSDLKIQVSQKIRTMTITGERRRVEGEPLEDSEGRKFRRRYERRMGKFSRTVRLAKDADATSIKAKVDKGVLHVTAAKVPKEPPTTDAVEIPID